MPPNKTPLAAVTKAAASGVFAMQERSSLPKPLDAAHGLCHALFVDA